MINIRNLVVCVFVAFCLAGLVFAGLPNKAQSGGYDPWCDVDDNGIINMLDLYKVALLYGTAGTPVAKASIEYDSGWINITDKCGQSFNITHNLGSMDITVDITGKTMASGGVHQRHLGLTDFTSGWSRTYERVIEGGALSLPCCCLVQTNDGGYAVASYTACYGMGGTDMYLIKTDACGNMMWNKTYGGASYEEAYALVQTSDGGYALAGRTWSYGAGIGDYWLVKTDAGGNAQWNKTYGGTGDDYAYALVQTNDGGYALAGRIAPDACLVKTDASGNMVWNKTYGGSSSVYSMVQTEDGGYALAGYNTTSGAWLMKTDADGNAQWSKTYSGLQVNSVIQTKDGGYAMVGVCYDSGDFGDIVLIKTDADGNGVWNKVYDKSSFDWGYSVFQADDGGYVLAAHVGEAEMNAWIGKTDWTGNILWEKTYQGFGQAISVVQTKDKGIAFAGFLSTAPWNWVWELRLIRTDSEFGLAWTDSTPNTITLYRGATDPYWNFVRVRIWKPKPTP